MADAPKRVGRKPLDPNDASVHVGVSMTARMIARFRQQARREGVTVQTIIRRMLRAATAERERSVK